MRRFHAVSRKRSRTKAPITKPAPPVIVTVCVVRGSSCTVLQPKMVRVCRRLLISCDTTTATTRAPP